MANTPADRILAAGKAIAEIFRSGEISIIGILAAFCGRGSRNPEQQIRSLKNKKTRNQFLARENALLTQIHKQAMEEAASRLLGMYESTAEEISKYVERLRLEGLVDKYENAADRAEELADYIETDLLKQGRDARQAVENLLNDLNRQWLESLKNMRRKVDDVYRQVIEAEHDNSADGGAAVRKAVEDALQNFAEKGVTGFTDRANRNWGIAEYSEMAMRTAMQRSNMLATIDTMLREGQDLCYVNRHLGSCPVCMGWEAKVFSLTGRTPGYMTLQQAMDSGLFHPNCAHILLVYIKGVTRLDIGRPEDVSNLDSFRLFYKRQQQRYLERNVRKWKRKQAASTTPEYERYCKHQVEYWQKRIRDYIKDNPQLPRRYDREGGKVVLSAAAKGEIEVKTAPDLTPVIIEPAKRDSNWRKTRTTDESSKLQNDIADVSENKLSNDTIAVSNKSSGNGVNAVCRIKKDIYSCIAPNVITEDVVITDERIEHSNRHNGAYDKYSNIIPGALANPDYIIEDNKKPNTGLVIKRITDENGKQLQIVLRMKIETDPNEYKNSIISCWDISDARLENYKRNRKILYKNPEV